MANDTYFKPDGTSITPSAWIGERSSPFSVSHQHGGISGLSIWGRYSGLKHGEDARGKPLIFEVSVDGDPDDRSHNGYHRYHAAFIDQASCQADFDRVKAAIIRGDVL